MTKGLQKYLILLLIILTFLCMQLEAVSHRKYRLYRKYLAKGRPPSTPKPKEKEKPLDSRELFKQLKRVTRKYCTCGPPILQSRFCQQDFVILADVNMEKGKLFQGLQEQRGSNHSSPGFPYSGIIIPSTVIESVKGPLVKNENLNIYFIRGTHCGLRDDVFPRRSGKYILGGFRIEVPECKNRSCHIPPEFYAVSRCGWSQPVEELTITQIAGLFFKAYDCGPDRCTIVPDIMKPENTTLVDPDVCYYEYQIPKCYSRYAMCVRVNKINGEKHCTMRSWGRISQEPSVLLQLPVEVHQNIRNAWVTDDDLLTHCKIINNLQSIQTT